MILSLYGGCKSDGLEIDKTSLGGSNSLQTPDLRSVSQKKFSQCLANVLKILKPSGNQCSTADTNLN